MNFTSALAEFLHWRCPLNEFKRRTRAEFEPVVESYAEAFPKTFERGRETWEESWEAEKAVRQMSPSFLKYARENGFPLLMDDALSEGAFYV